MRRIDTDKNLLEKIRENPPKSVSSVCYSIILFVALWLSGFVAERLLFL
ncbi:MAG: hypothetical protein AB1797_14075 [bacterium]